MAGNEDIMVTVLSDITKIMEDFKKLEEQTKVTAQTIEKELGPATDNTGTKMSGLGGRMTSAGQKIKSALGTETALAFGAAGAAATKFSKDCISSAITAESEWSRFGALVDSNGGNWDEQEKGVKKWAKTFSNEHGYMVSDTRAASAALLQYGVKADQLGDSMNGVAALAARTGSTEEEAANVVISALNGKANALRKATGLEIENYKAADGSIDTQRLLTDIYNQNSEALKKHGETTEAQMNKMQNSFNTIKSEIGQALLPVVQILAGALTTIAQAFSNLPGPVKSVIAVVLLIGGAIGIAIGALGMLAPVLINLGTIITAISDAGGILLYLKGGLTTLTSIIPGLSGAVGGLGLSFTSVLWPVLAIIAAFAALYYIGLKMGWWNDLSGMIAKFGEVLGWVGGQLIEFGKWVSLLFTDFPAAMDQLRGWIDSLGPMVTDFLANIGPILQDLGNKIWQDLVNVFKNIDPKILLAVLMPLPTLIFNILSYLAPIVSQALTGALNELNKWGNDLMTSITNSFNNAINAAIQWVVDFVNSINQGLTDSVNGLNAWGNNLVNGISTALGNAVNSAVQGATNIVNGIVNAFMGIGARIQYSFQLMVMYIRMYLAQARMTALNIINQIRTTIVTRIRQIPIQVGIQFMRIVQTIRTRLNQARAIAQTLATRIRQVIIQRIQAVVGRLRGLFGQVVSTVSSTLSNAASTALSKAQEIYNNIVNEIMKIPQRIGDEFNKIPDRIRSALANAASAALQGAQAIVNAVLGAFHIASPGIIQRKVVGEFADTADRIGESDSTAISNAANSAKSVVSAYMSNMRQLPVMDLGLNSNALSSNISSMSQALRGDYGSSRAASVGSVRNTNSVTNDNRSNTKTIVFENVTLDCTNLSTNEARQLFYKAVEGL